MQAVIKSIFWSDQRIGDLPPEDKLAILWLLTNRDRDICGFCKPSKRTFEFETGIPFEALRRACEALPGSFHLLSCGTFLVRNFIRHQFSKCGVVSTSNNVVRSAVKRALQMPEALRRAFFEANPELIELSESLAEKNKPFEPLPRGKSKSKRESIKEEGYGEEPSPATSITAETIVASYPRREDTAQCIVLVEKHIANGENPEAMLAGTRAIAAAIAQLPARHLNKYVIGATKFFRDKRWTDDPATWLRQASTAGTTADGAKLELGGRRAASVTKIPYTPAK